MTTEKKPRPDARERRQRWFENHVREMNANSVIRPPENGVRFRCPCCRYLTLGERGGYEICPVCFWEDDGQDDGDAARVRGGPNGSLSLEAARRNFGAYQACEERHRVHVRPPTDEEREGSG
jgi:hypothetical protein